MNSKFVYIYFAIIYFYTEVTDSAVLTAFFRKPKHIKAAYYSIFRKVTSCGCYTDCKCCNLLNTYREEACRHLLYIHQRLPCVGEQFSQQLASLPSNSWLRPGGGEGGGGLGVVSIIARLIHACSSAFRACLAKVKQYGKPTLLLELSCCTLNSPNLKVIQCR